MSRPLTSADLVEGAILPDILHDGSLIGTFPFDPEAPTVKFMLSVKVPFVSDYAEPGQVVRYLLFIEVLPHQPGPIADAEAAKDSAWVTKCNGREVSVQLGGLRVDRVTADGGKRKVYCSAAGPRVFKVRDRTRVLRQKSTRSNRVTSFEFHTPAPEAGPSRQAVRETSLELSPPRVSPNPAATSGDQRRRSQAEAEAGTIPRQPQAQAPEAQAVPLSANRSRSPRPLSTHAPTFKPGTLKRVAEPEGRAGKNIRLSPQSSASLSTLNAQAGPSRAPPPPPHARPQPMPEAACTSLTSTTEQVVHPQFPPAPSQPVQRRAAVTTRVDLSTTPVAVPRPTDGRGRQYLPSPSTIRSSRDTIETPFTTQDDFPELIDFTHSSHPPRSHSQLRVPSQSVALSQPAEDSQSDPPNMPPPQPQGFSQAPPAATPQPRPRVSPEFPHVPRDRLLDVGHVRIRQAEETQAERKERELAELKEMVARLERERDEYRALERSRAMPRAARESENDERYEGKTEEKDGRRAERRDDEGDEEGERAQTEQEEAERKAKLVKAQRARGLGKEQDQSAPEARKRPRETLDDEEIQREARKRWAKTSAREATERAGPQRDAMSHGEKVASRGSDIGNGKQRASISSSASISTAKPRVSSVSQSPVPPARPLYPRAQSITDLRRAAEERALRANAARIAQHAYQEGVRVAEASKLTDDFTAGVYTYNPLLKLEVGGAAKNLMGVVVRIDPIRTTRAADNTLTLVVADPSTHTNGAASDDMQVTIFRKLTELQNHRFEVGRSVLFRNIKVSEWRGRPKGNVYSGSGNEWFVLCGNAALHGGGQQIRPITQSEVSRLKALESWWHSDGCGSAERAGTEPTTSPAHSARSGTGKDKTLGQVQGGDFLNGIVKILHVERGRNSRLELYVSDGTVNRLPTRNFHQIDARIPPSALFCLTIFDADSTTADELHKVGAVVRFPNLRAKDYGGLELNWSEGVDTQQRARGWNEKSFRVLRADDERAVEVEARLAELRAAHARGEAVTAAAAAPLSPTSAPTRPNLPPPVNPISMALTTTYTDEAAHPRSTVNDAIANKTVPNRFRTFARVREIVPRNAKGSQPQDLAVLWCKKCENTFPKDHCLSCGDKKLLNADVQWQMYLDLEAELGEGEEQKEENWDDGKFVAVLGGDVAAAILPPLPPIAPRMGPNEVKRLRNRITTEFSPKVADLLLGAKFNGEHTRPLIDLTLESYGGGANGGLDRLMFRVFGMRKGRG